MSVARAFWTALLALLAVATSAPAHDFGSMKVVATFTADRYVIEITLFPEHLPAARRPEMSGERFAEYARAFADAAAIRFDGAPAAPEVAPLAPPASVTDQVVMPPPAIRLSGVLPPGATSFAWSHGWPKDDYLLCSQNPTSAEPACQWISGDSASTAFDLSQASVPSSTLSVVREYLVLGFTHIVPKGLDHILFVLGLFLLTTSPRALLWQVTAFTIAHSLTLALSIYGIVRLSPSIVEPLIALSIAYIAIENIVRRKPGPFRFGVVFLFGLLHGMGFAGVLTELGLPRTQFVPALVAFNVGVEIGQLAVIAAAYMAVGAWFGRKDWYRSRITIPASIAIGCVGLFWTVERLM